MTKYTNKDIIPAFKINLDTVQLSLIERLSYEVKPIGDIIYEVLENLRKHRKSKIIFTKEQEEKYQRLFDHCPHKVYETSEIQLFALTDERIVDWPCAVHSDLSLNEIINVILKTLVSKRIDNSNTTITISEKVQQQWQYQKERYDEAIYKEKSMKEAIEIFKEYTEENEE